MAKPRNGRAKRTAAQQDQLKRVRMEAATKLAARSAEARGSRGAGARRSARHWYAEVHVATPHDWMETELEEGIDPGRSPELKAAMCVVQQETEMLRAALPGRLVNIVLTTQSSHGRLRWSSPSNSKASLYGVDLSKKPAIVKAGLACAKARGDEAAARVCKLHEGQQTSPWLQRLVDAAREEAQQAHADCYLWLGNKRLKLYFDSNSNLVVLCDAMGRLMEIFCLGDMRALFSGNSLHRKAVRGLERATQKGAFSRLMALQLKEGWTFARVAKEYNVSTKHSNERMHFHDFVSVHACSSANGRLVIGNRQKRDRPAMLEAPPPGSLHGLVRGHRPPAAAIRT